jgi:hypothetical protein
MAEPRRGRRLNGLFWVLLFLLTVAIIALLRR